MALYQYRKGIKGGTIFWCQLSQLQNSCWLQWEHNMHRTHMQYPYLAYQTRKLCPLPWPPSQVLNQLHIMHLHINSDSPIPQCITAACSTCKQIQIKAKNICSQQIWDGMCLLKESFLRGSSFLFFVKFLYWAGVILFYLQQQQIMTALLQISRGRLSVRKGSSVHLLPLSLWKCELSTKTWGKSTLNCKSLTQTSPLKNQPPSMGLPNLFHGFKSFQQPQIPLGVIHAMARASHPQLGNVYHRTTEP